MSTETSLLAGPIFGKRSTFSHPVRAILLAASYVLGGYLGNASSRLMGGDVPLVWVPSGIALAAILLFGYRMWWGVALGACVFTLVEGRPPGLFMLATAIGNTIGAILCAYLLDRFVQFHFSMSRVKYATGFILFACLAGATVNAVFNVIGLCYGGQLPGDELLWRQVCSAALVWWVPNAMGALVVTPLILAWAAPDSVRWTKARAAEAVICGLGLFVGTQLSFNSWFVYGVENYPLAYLPYPFLVWGALRFGLRGATTGTFGVAGLSIYELLHRQGPFWAGPGHEQTSLMLIGCYLVVVAVGNLLLAAAAVERERAVRATVISERRYRGVVEDQSDQICRFKPDGTLVFVNESYCRFQGEPRENLIGSNFFPALPERDREIPLSNFRTLTPANPIMTFDNKLMIDAGKCVWQQCMVRAFFDEYGEITEFQAVLRDITRRKQTEEALRQSEERLQVILHSMPDGVVVLDERAAVTLFNPVAEKIFQRKAEQTMGLSLAELFAPGDRSAYGDCLAGRHAKGSSIIELCAQRPGGGLVPVDVAVKEISCGGARLSIVVVRDISERKKLENQYRQAQKMEAVGRLAGGIAHDFNNLMQAILGYINLLDRRLPPGDPNHEAVQQIQKSLAHASSLTRQLLAFSRKQVVKTRVLPLNACVSDMTKLLQRTIGETIQLDIHLAQPAPFIRADPGQIEQMILNLAINARDAMPTGGTLGIETGVAEFAEGAIVGSERIEAGSYAILRIADSGCGMTADVQAHLFEPFFTTKESGKGTGLGLCNVYGIVKQSGGEIVVTSQLGHGTTIEIYLPRADASLAEDDSTRQAVPKQVRGTETVLLVEDEETVRMMLAEVLKAADYNVLDARHGADALELAARHQGTIHLLVTDMTMPGFSGSELAHRLTDARPNLRVLFISGYTEVETSQVYKFQQPVQFLQKPFHPDALLTKTRQLLDRKFREGSLADN